MPKLCIANNLALDPIPPCLQQLNDMELRLICRVQTFQTILVLQHGHAQYITNLAAENFFESTYFLLLKQLWLVSLNFNRKICNLAKTTPESKN